MKEIDLKSSTVDKALDLAKDFLQTLIGPSVGELGQFFADKVKVWRLKNQINTLGKVQKIIKEKNIEPKQVNLKVLLPYLDAVSLEVDENLQVIWANLLVNYIDSTKNLTSVVYPQILRQLSSDEIDFLLLLYNQNDKSLLIGSRSEDKFGIEDCSNLNRLGIVYGPQYASHRGIRGLPRALGKNNLIQMTHFGITFIEACQRK